MKASQLPEPVDNELLKKFALRELSQNEMSRIQMILADREDWRIALTKLLFNGEVNRFGSFPLPHLEASEHSE